jgi:hypothetical protein
MNTLPLAGLRSRSALALTEGASGAIRGKKAMRAMLEWPDWEGGEIEQGLSIPLARLNHLLHLTRIMPHHRPPGDKSNNLALFRNRS